VETGKAREGDPRGRGREGKGRKGSTTDRFPGGRNARDEADAPKESGEVMAGRNPWVDKGSDVG